MSLDKITVYKLKDHITAFEQYIKELDGKRQRLPGLREIAIVPTEDGPIVQASFAFKEHESEKKAVDVPWIQFINESAPDPIIFQSRNKFPCAVLAVKIQDEQSTNFYALTFGLGADTFIDMEQIVRDFGLRVAMNICDTEKLKRIQTNIHEAVSTHSEKQISTGSNLNVFQIDDEKEFLRSVSGLAREEFTFIHSLTGKDSISIKLNKNAPLNWNSLVQRLQTLEESYNLERYLETFQGYSKFHFENDPDTISQLDELLFEKIRTGDLEHIHLAPPEFVDYDSRYFTYELDGGERHDDISIIDFLATRKRAFSERASISSLKQKKIYIWSTETGQRINAWTAYKCLVAEITLNDETYILSISQWKKISTDFKNEVESYIAHNIPHCDHPYLLEGVRIWDAAQGKNREDVYNTTIYQAEPDIFLFDRAKIQIAGERIYEVCDLLHIDKSLIHVKRLKAGTASISHLFLQGKFYSEAFVTDQKCRQGMKDHIINNNNGRAIAAFTDILPNERETLITNDYKIIFCILTERNNANIDIIPFMAKYELMHSHKYINQALGFQCEYKIISVLEGAP
ncbi:hypothetical protein C4K05_2401 [Pseudomonas chlororaphis subsp. aureofaciens]|uniref:Sporadically distributed protein, TIGR04141 family n=1 Tax=Pseudomonas chlororaphis subsp. aureofaciens TaxID=587851 RepID=A0AAD0ZHA5_9PSED|nr:DUF6119 family protein [Pseudomonas chlororaphis]AZE29083.1 hypothetical protein C4K07_2298 [Pseudomonas chlororaphis subsp. aureofaciens]AZE35385.1 hypothetical protein C4K06_2352 [Pseudomonas chlororaphis subsp. aureofaciens]AZE41741.1 hypothetical protein C4K05_2401 [Pseudomonas chlororaphis subsp. aureofaciens]